MKVFKVKHRPTGLYWKGNGFRYNQHASPRPDRYNLKDDNFDDIIKICFSELGAAWSKIEHLKSDVKIILHESNEYKDILTNCDVIEVVVKEKTLKSTPLCDIVKIPNCP